VRERGAVRLYGSGLVSSHADGAHALSAGCDRRAFSLDAVLAQPYVVDRLQDVLFVLDSFDQLWASVEAMEARLRAA
jgi:phenylalanine-4-hydroxylase